MSNIAMLKKRAGTLNEIARLSFKFQRDSEEAVTLSMCTAGSHIGAGCGLRR